ncbi:hypothetical protein VIGAN_07127200, partial [Vigna angularis var. angularis]
QPLRRSIKHLHPTTNTHQNLTNIVSPPPYPLLPHKFHLHSFIFALWPNLARGGRYHLVSRALGLQELSILVLYLSLCISCCYCVVLYCLPLFTSIYVIFMVLVCSFAEPFGFYH